MIRTNTRFRAAWVALVCLGLVAATPHIGTAQQGQTTARNLKIKLNYSGAGPVDEKHRIFLFLFDSLDFAQSPANAMPVDRTSAPAKDATVSFSGIATSPVYVVAVYDPAGSYDGMSAPPSGTIVALYAKTSSQPESIKIEEGKTAEIELAFDDTARMP